MTIRMTDLHERSIDVAILGGGLAGNLLARQLRREAPDLSVALFERTGAPRWKVGESTVEIASHYLMRRLGLGTYLYDEHLPKNGLRFFFDTPNKDAELTQMSEIGTDRPPPMPSFQLDRARLEADLRTMNRDDGVEVYIGWTAKDLALGEGGEPHRFTVISEEGDRRRYRARWVVDATGRASTIARQLDLRTEEPVHHLSAVWGRFTDVQDIDAVGDDAWRGRARHVARVLSTNHFCYPGYWIWFIPLGRGVTSVGLVGHKDVFRRGIRTQEGFRAFLAEHRAVGSLMERAEPHDLEGYTQLAYGVKRFFSRDRWGLLGDAGAFTDPFYSPGSDFIGLECDFLTDLIRRDAAGEDVAERTDAYDAFMQFRWEATMLVYRDLYSVFGSYELMKVKFNFDFGCYLNLWFDPFARDLHLDLKYLSGELRKKREVMAALGNFTALFRRAEAHLRREGTYHRSNLGQYNVGVDVVRPMIDELMTPRKKHLVDKRTEAIFNYGREEALKLLDAPSVSAPLRLHQFADPSAFG